jgi:hypothetical protein
VSEQVSRDPERLEGDPGELELLVPSEQDVRREGLEGDAGLRVMYTGAPASRWSSATPPMWSMSAWVMRTAAQRAPPSASSIRSVSPGQPGSTTTASSAPVRRTT